MAFLNKRNHPCMVSGKTYSVYLPVVGMLTFSEDHPQFNQVCNAIEDGHYEKARDYLDPRSRVVKYVTGSRFALNSNDEIVDTQEDNKVVTSFITNQIIKMAKSGVSIEPLLMFMERLVANPSYRVRERLYSWLSNAQMPITKDGMFLAYKRVNKNYTSCHDNKTMNAVGTFVEMPRREVDDNDDRTCSHGLHVCSRGYLSSFSGDVVLLCVVDPADVVAIPKDYNDTKMRVCKYFVKEDVTTQFPELDKKLQESCVYSPEDDEDDDDDWYSDEDVENYWD